MYTKNSLFFLLICIFFSSVLFAQNVEIKWQSDALLKDPESIVYDKKRACFYVSNMDKSTPVQDLLTDPVSMLSLDGKTVEVDWMTGFSTPTGLLLKNDFLYVVERNGVAIVDVENKKVLQRISVPNTGYLNDITMGRKGRIFITDSERGNIFRIVDGKSELWYATPSGGGINGILLDGKNILFGDNGDHTFKSICIKNKKVQKIAYLGEGNIDGIQKLSKHQYLVSHFLGNLYQITLDGNVKEIFNSRGENLFIADFTYIPERQEIVIPSLRTHHIFSLSYEP